MRATATLCALVLSITYGCKKPYAPRIVSDGTNYLVVEGEINSSNDSTIINLSRTVSISAQSISRPESGAQVTIENDQQAVFPLQESVAGTYGTPPISLDTSRRYRLRIKTTDGKEYLSDFVPVKNAPPIDSVGYTIQSNGLSIYVNTHDNTNKTRYYRWDYTETWVFTSAFPTSYKLVSGIPEYRPPSEQIFQCWGNDNATDISLATSIHLSQDVIAGQQLTFIPSTAEKLESRYSIIVREYALTGGGYNYYANLKKNTEQLGSIFDAEPSSVKGNITCTTNPSVPVIGFISAGAVTSKRIFIDNSVLPNWLPVTYYEQIDCQADTVTLTSFDEYSYVPPPFVPVSTPLFAAPPKCVDCTLRGTNIKPSFWQ